MVTAPGLMCNLSAPREAVTDMGAPSPRQQDEEKIMISLHSKLVVGVHEVVPSLFLYFSFFQFL
jgi:hypothetical protein